MIYPKIDIKCNNKKLIGKISIREKLCHAEVHKEIEKILNLKLKNYHNNTIRLDGKNPMRDFQDNNRNHTKRKNTRQSKEHKKTMDDK